VATTCSASGDVIVAPEGCEVVQAYIDQVNAQGGIHGHPLKLETCDNQQQPTLTINCERQFIDNKSVVAMIGNEEDDSFQTLSAQNSIANIGPVVIEKDTWSSPDSFPVSDFSELGGSLGALVQYGVNTGKSKHPLLMLCQFTACQVVQTALTEKYQALGLPLQDIVVPNAAPTFASYVAKAQSENADFVLMAEPSAALAGIMQAATQVSYHPIFGLTFSCYDQSTLKLLGQGTYQAYCPSPFKSWTQAGAQMQAVMDKYGPSKWNWNYEGVNSWVAVHMFVQAAKSISGPVTRSSVLTAMHHMSNFTNEFLPQPLDFAKPGVATYAPNVVNYDWYVYQVKDGSLAPLTANAVNVPPIKTS
jgi:ABC-type branched-subunit amino acid transport system substrate-binding protein